MSSLKELRWSGDPAPATHAGRRLAAALLQRASCLLARLASGLAHPASETRGEPHFEFHAKAGAAEGALYVDGRLVGWISGVSRL
jgi:hypothetical protein